MKKLLLIATILMMTVATGCSNAGKDETQEVYTNTTPKTKYADLIPKPEKLLGDVDILITDPDGGTAYIFQIKNATKEQFETYSAECEKYDFTDIRFQTDIAFGAYSPTGKYWTEVHFDEEKSIIYVICQKSENYEPLED